MMHPAGLLRSRSRCGLRRHKLLWRGSIHRPQTPMSLSELIIVLVRFLLGM